MNIAKVEIAHQPAIRLTVELSNTHAAELASLLVRHVSFLDFPWAEEIYDAIELATDLRDEDVFRDAEFGAKVFLERRSEVTERRGVDCQCAICLGGSK